MKLARVLHFGCETTNLSYQFVHIVAPSGGTWFADGLTDRLKALGFSGRVQMTILDGYHTSAVRVPGDGQTVLEEIGDTADYVENYFHMGFCVDGTCEVLDNALNINVTALDPTYSLLDLNAGLEPKFHDFPLAWYLHTVNEPFGLSTHEYGFKNSAAILGELPTTTSPGKGRFLEYRIC